MIQHIVMLSLKDDLRPAVLQDVMGGLAALRDQITGFTAFHHGPNKDFEAKSQDYPYGFVCTFADTGALQTYADHPDHKLLGARLVALCNGGGDGIWVADIEVS